jgi:hypothetical protein
MADSGTIQVTEIFEDLQNVSPLLFGKENGDANR